jgi:hypothetical protein
VTWGGGAGAGGGVVTVGDGTVDEVVGSTDSPIVTSGRNLGGSACPVRLNTTTTAAKRAAAITSRAAVRRDGVTRDSLVTDAAEHVKPS